MVINLLLAIVSGLFGVLVGAVGLAVAQRHWPRRDQDNSKISKQVNSIFFEKDLYLFERGLEDQNSSALEDRGGNELTLQRPTDQVTTIASSVPAGTYEATVEKAFQDEGYVNLVGHNLMLRVVTPGRYWPQGSPITIQVQL